MIRQRNRPRHSTSQSCHHWLTPAQVKQQLGPSPAAFAAAREALESAGLTVIAEHAQHLTAQSPVTVVEKLFSTKLTQVNAPAPFQFFHRNVSGNNNGFTVQPGQAYSEALGNGTLDVRNIVGLQGVRQPAHLARPAIRKRCS